MKKYFLSLLDPAHRRWTIYLFLAGVLLIIGSQVVGIMMGFIGLICVPGIVTGI